MIRIAVELSNAKHRAFSLPRFLPLCDTGWIGNRARFAEK
jgi:hypothetical protein